MKNKGSSALYSSIKRTPPQPRRIRMKLGSLAFTATYAPFTYLRHNSQLETIFSQSNHLLLSAPSGSGKKTLVHQWLAQNQLSAVWLCDQTIDRVDQQSSPCIVLQISQLSLLNTADRLHKLELAMQKCRVILLSERSDMETCDLLCQRNFRCYFIDDLTFKESEVEVIVKLILGSAAPARFHLCLYAYSRGWPKATFGAIEDFMRYQYTDPAICELRCRQMVQECLSQVITQPTCSQLESLKLTDVIGQLPKTMAHHTANQIGLSRDLSEAFDRGLLKYEWVSEHEQNLSTSLLGKLLLANSQDLNIDERLDETLTWLCKHNQYQIALPILLSNGKIDQAETAIRSVADKLISQFQIERLYSWIITLDTVTPIDDPILLLVAVRCTFYSGKTHDFNYFFQRLLESVNEETLAKLREDNQSNTYCRFLSEYKLFCQALNQPHRIPESAELPTNKNTDFNNPITLFQVSLQRAHAGELSSIIPLLDAGIQRTDATREVPQYLMFSLIYVWTLVLSTEYSKANNFVSKLKQTLGRNKIIYLGAYDWIDILEILLLRINGNLTQAELRISTLLESDAFTNDFQKLYLLINLQADIYLVLNRHHEASHAISRLASIQNSTAKESYWFASADTMFTTLSVITGQTSLYIPPKHHLDAQSKICSNLSQQTELLWTIKLHMSRNSGMNVMPSLEELHQQFSQGGQWLRVLEVDILRSVSLYRQGKQREGIALFDRIFLGLEKKSSLGAILDPFLLWEELLHYRKSFNTKSKAIVLLATIKPEHKMRTSFPKSNFPREKLSKREIQVLELTVDGKTSQEIADELCISITTVRTHIQNVYRKLEVYNRAEATAIAIKNNLVEHT